MLLHGFTRSPPEKRQFHLRKLNIKPAITNINSVIPKITLPKLRIIRLRKQLFLKKSHDP